MFLFCFVPGTVLGGTMELQGAHISLGCFHGINFKSKSWALFSLKDTFISFATEAQQVPTENGKNFSILGTKSTKSCSMMTFQTVYMHMYVYVTHDFTLSDRHHFIILVLHL